MISRCHAGLEARLRPAAACTHGAASWRARRARRRSAHVVARGRSSAARARSASASRGRRLARRCFVSSRRPAAAARCQPEQPARGSMACAASIGGRLLRRQCRGEAACQRQPRGARAGRPALRRSSARGRSAAAPGASSATSRRPAPRCPRTRCAARARRLVRRHRHRSGASALPHAPLQPHPRILAMAVPQRPAARRPAAGAQQRRSAPAPGLPRSARLKPRPCSRSNCWPRE